MSLGISILGSAITMFVAYCWKFRRLFEKYEFRNQISAEREIIRDIKKSKTLRVYAMCGSTFSNEENSAIAKAVFNDNRLHQKYLISHEENSKIEDRQKELPKEAENLKTKVQNSLNSLNAKIETNKKIELRRHKNKVGFRLIILDDCLYLSQQEKNKSGKEAKMQKISSDQPAYINFSDYFDEQWDLYAAA